jgi:FkbM family methyltransferase
MRTIIEFLWRNNVHTLLDVGANTGEWSSYIRAHIPDLKVFMIEGNPDCAPLLKTWGAPFEIACLSDSAREVKLYKNPANAVCTGTSYYLENTKFYHDDIYDVVTTRTLDDVVSQRFGQIFPFDYVKMDTQGSEADIIRGGGGVIGACKFLQLELSLIPYNKGAPLKDEMIAFAGERGFSPVLKVEEHYLDEGRQLIQEDWIFAKEGVSPLL